MEATISNAMFLLSIGMITVFSILALVIFCGRILISIVNKWFPEKKKSLNPSEDISKQTLQVLNATIKQLTASKGVIHKVEKLK